MTHDDDSVLAARRLWANKDFLNLMEVLKSDQLEVIIEIDPLRTDHLVAARIYYDALRAVTQLVYQISKEEVTDGR